MAAAVVLLLSTTLLRPVLLTVLAAGVGSITIVTVVVCLLPEASCGAIRPGLRWLLDTSRTPRGAVVFAFGSQSDDQRGPAGGGVLMGDRPYTVLSCCISLDGYIDDAADRRLLLSNEADFDRVDAVRASSDAILVGAATVRNDDPRLLVRSPAQRAERVRRGLPANPTKVTVTEHGKLDPAARFFTAGDADRLVYCATPTLAEVRSSLGALAGVVDAGHEISMAWVCRDLFARGIRRLLVEGGGTVLTQFLTQGLADELHLVVAPIFVGDPGGTRFVEPGAFPWCGERRAHLVGPEVIGDVVLLRYALSERFPHDTEEAT